VEVGGGGRVTPHPQPQHNHSTPSLPDMLQGRLGALFQMEVSDCPLVVGRSHEPPPTPALPVTGRRGGGLAIYLPSNFLTVAPPPF
jgi:hypothetical protein